MKDLSQRCIFSNSSENLNTIMEIMLDDEKYKVAISDEYEDEASPSKIKRLIPKRIAEIEQKKNDLISKFEEFKSLAAELGFDLIPKGQQITNPPDTDALKNKPIVKIGDSEFKAQKNTRKEEKTGTAGLSKEEAISAFEAAKRAAQIQRPGESPNPGEAPSYSPHSVPESIAVNTGKGSQIYEKPEKGVQSNQTVIGAAGIPTKIPRNIQGTDGETTISVINTGGDRTIQLRGKQLAQMREMGQGSFYSFDCRACKGTGLRAKNECRSCKGSGIII